MTWLQLLIVIMSLHKVSSNDVVLSFSDVKYIENNTTVKTINLTSAMLEQLFLMSAVIQSADTQNSSGEVVFSKKSLSKTLLRVFVRLWVCFSSNDYSNRMFSSLYVSCQEFLLQDA